MSLIEISHLRKEYPDITPLADVSVNIEAGEVISIIGPSGTGKSTLLRCINRLETPTSGSIVVNGQDVCDPKTDLPQVRKKMGMVFQSFNLFAHKTVVENIMMPQQDLLGTEPKAAYEEAMKQLRLVGLESKARKFPDELSGGQKQRVAIARALAMHPDILLFDEPTSALDPTMVSEVLTVIRDLAKTGLTMLIVTHEMRLARDVSTRIFFMNDGGICEDGTPEQIFEHPEKPETRTFIFRIRDWTYTLSADSSDFYEMMASLEVFCGRQFLGKKETMKCRLAVEELSANYLLPYIKQHPESTAELRLSAGENGTDIRLALKLNGFPDFDLAAMQQDDLSLSILQKIMKRQPDEDDAIVFSIV